MATPETVTKILREGPQPARALYERLGVSQPTLSRLTSQLGESILRFGKARQTQYALRRKLGSQITFPLYRVSASGNLEQWGLLHPIMPEGYLVETWATQLNGHGNCAAPDNETCHARFPLLNPLEETTSHSTRLQTTAAKSLVIPQAGEEANESLRKLHVTEARTEIHPGLPWYLQDMRPQGFLGRSFARFHGPMLGLPVDPTRWSDDQALLALANTGHDTPGNLLVGEESASHFQTNALFSKLDSAFQPVPSEQRLQAYPEFARLALSGEVIGSSAGGEQPKFNIRTLRDGQPVHVMVKFSAPQDNATTRRWRSLLICEHLAFQVLSGAFPSSKSELLSADVDGVSQLFLEVPRFDRVGGRGRLGVVSLKAIDDEFAGLATDWPKIAAALVQSGKLSEAVYQQVQKLHAFGVLIGNGDMHPGNLSFFVDDVTKPNPAYTLAPVYDMLPMSLAPRPSGQIPDALPMPRIGINPPLEVWKEMLPLAIRYWHQVAAHPGVEDDVRQMTQKQADILTSSLAPQ